MLPGWYCILLRFWPVYDLCLKLRVTVLLACSGFSPWRKILSRRFRRAALYTFGCSSTISLLVSNHPTSGPKMICTLGFPCILGYVACLERHLFTNNWCGLPLKYYVIGTDVVKPIMRLCTLSQHVAVKMWVLLTLETDTAKQPWCNVVPLPLAAESLHLQYLYDI